jgi:pimeloyl-ACP methyl ester carboxylesterase
MNNTMQAKSQTLEVPGASLYYEVLGSGPVLLMIPGGPANAGDFKGIAGELASDFTVVTYDPRGLAHSKLEGSFDDDQAVQIAADDVQRLLRAVTDEPAFVFGSSGGAVIGLDLVARYPTQVRTFISHEPPAAALLPNPARERAAMEEIVDTYRAAGIGAAMQKFMVQARIRGGPPPQQQGEPTPQQREAMAQMQHNMDFWLGHTFHAVAIYEPDFEALRRGPTRIVPGVGAESRGELAHEGGLGLASALGKEAVVFPGAHGGFGSDPREFAAKLREVLAAGPARATG